jgi:hypothetical protein
MSTVNIPIDFLERAAPERVREAADVDWVVYHLDELNCLGDRLRYIAGDDQAHDSELTDVLRRVHEIVEAMRLVRGAVDAVLQWIETSPPQPEFPEDYFAPALVLLKLAPEESALHRFDGRVCEEARVALDMATGRALPR